MDGGVKDVDSWLQIPGVRQPLGYTILRTNYHSAHLDRDDTDWNGPETITIYEAKPGTYVFWVNNYNFRNSSGAERGLGNSSVRVEVYREDQLLKTYSVPRGTGLSYEVFRIVNGNLVDTGEFFDGPKTPDSSQR
jgi:hypothetical protein